MSDNTGTVHLSGNIGHGHCRITSEAGGINFLDLGQKGLQLGPDGGPSVFLGIEQLEDVRGYLDTMIARLSSR